MFCIQNIAVNVSRDMFVGLHAVSPNSVNIIFLLWFYVFFNSCHHITPLLKCLLFLFATSGLSPLFILAPFMSFSLMAYCWGSCSLNKWQTHTHDWGKEATTWLITATVILAKHWVGFISLGDPHDPQCRPQSPSETIWMCSSFWRPCGHLSIHGSNAFQGWGASPYSENAL